LLAYQAHIASVEAALDTSLREDDPFPEGSAQEIAKLRNGATIVELCSGKRPIQVPDGLIHDWSGLICVFGATIQKTLALLQDYDNHQNVYQPEVIGSRLIARQGDDFQIFLRLRKKKIVTVILDTDHHVHYFPVNATRWACYSRTTRISEVEDAGKPTETVRPPDTGYGFLWRLNSYWRFEEAEDCTYIECRAISLTRDVPGALAWVIQPMVLKLPRDSLKATLEATRRGLSLPAARA
jgi:hypothetical protein